MLMCLLECILYFLLLNSGAPNLKMKKMLLVDVARRDDYGVYPKKVNVSALFKYGYNK